MRTVASFLQIPLMAIGFAVGLIVRPIYVGYAAACEVVDAHHERAAQRAQDRATSKLHN